jgi:hypothetical protein
MILRINPFVFDSPSTASNGSELGLKITAKCYTVGDSADNADGLTLLFTHCIGSRTSTPVPPGSELIASSDKEQWEPTISQLFQTQGLKEDGQRIREAWSFDWQNHGDAAILNQAVLSTREGVCE